MKPIYHYQKISGEECVFYLNKSGGMWFAVVDGKAYGDHIEFEGDVELTEQEKLLKQFAQEKINLIKTL